MLLKKLELFGFKSFADRTDFEFNSGMTSVVGPNGCGKSNVVDAFKWIFGEQSAKGLRGSEMKDVIFSGTQKRKPTGFAEATVVFDNSQAFFSVDFAEVAITRRLYRSGESEYLINKEKCRLKDIRELVMGTGMGRTSYSILEQGKIDVLLQANQQERRIIFEEAAGISKFRAKKAETLRALARVEDNLTRLTDIVDEVEKRVQRLKAQASKARRYRAHAERLKELRVRAAVEDFKTSVSARTDLSFRRHWAEFQIRRLDSVTERLGERLEERVRGRQALLSRLRDERGKLAEEQVLLERTKQRIDHGRERLAELEIEHDRKQSDVAATDDTLGKLDAQLSAEREQLVGLEGEMEAGRSTLEERTEVRDRLRAENERLQQSARARKDELVALMQRRSVIANQLVQLRSEIAALTERRDRLDLTQAALGEQLEQERVREQAEGQTVAEERRELERLECERQTAETALVGLQTRAAEFEAALEIELTSLHQKQSRYEVLKTLEENLEGVARGARDLLEKKEALEEFGDVHGLLAALVRVDRRYAKAVEGILGSHAQALVVETQDGALGLLDVVRSEEMGAVEVICLDRVSRADVEPYPPHEGVVGELRELVSASDLFDDLLDRLLAGVLLVEDFETAVRLSRNGLRAYRLVTLEGEVIEPWGALGLSGQADLGLISRRSEMEELAVEVASAEERERKLRGDLATARAETDSCRGTIDQLAETIAERGTVVAQSEEKLAQVRRDIDRLEREIAVGSSERDELLSEAASRGEERTRQESELCEVEGQCTSCEQAITDEEEHARGIATEAQLADEALTQSRLELAQAERRSEGLRELVSRQEANRDEKLRLLETLHQEIAELARRSAETTATIETADAEILIVGERITSLVSLVEADEAADEELQSMEQSVSAELDRIRKECDRLRGIRESLQLRDQEERHRRNTTLERLDEEHGIDLFDLMQWESRALERYAAPPADSEEAVGESESEAGGESSSESTEDHTEQADGTEQATDAAAEQDASPFDTRWEGMPDEARFLVPTEEWDRATARTEIKEIQDKLRRMGSVNLEALEELEELEERLQFQVAQRDDLVESRDRLTQIIEEINHTSREMFTTTFEEVRRHFAELFRKSFGGGKADLVLDEGVDVLESGIEIVARPPGKKISSLSLMSGGEKTMTTLALLFAIFRARPCPFCILDEVDAPLDEANVGRFVVLLREFTDDTQFIVVTHNKSTMAEANTLYGVTMQERGVSTKVAVELESFDVEEMEEQAVRN